MKRKVNTYNMGTTFEYFTREYLRNLCKKYGIKRGRNKTDTINNLTNSNIEIEIEMDIIKANEQAKKSKSYCA